MSVAVSLILLFVGLIKCEWIMGNTTLPYDGDANMGIGLDPTDNKTIWFIGCRGIYSFDTETEIFTINDTLSQELNDTFSENIENILPEGYELNEDIANGTITNSSIPALTSWENHVAMCVQAPINILAMTSTVYDNKIYLIVSNARAFVSFDLVEKKVDVIYNYTQERPWFWRPTICNYKDDQLLFKGSGLEVVGQPRRERPTLPFNLTNYTDIGSVTDDDFLESQRILRYEGSSCYYDEDSDIMWFMGGMSTQAQRTVSKFINQSWTSKSNVLTNNRYSMDLVVNDKYMYIIGGGIYDGSNDPSEFVRKTQVINMDDDSTWIRGDMELNQNRAFVKTVLVGDIIYAFGGLISYTVGSVTAYEDTWEYFNLSAPTSSPTMAPTMDTSLPTSTPSISPTMAPTMNTTTPTSSPTGLTEKPTSDPTITPTMEPTKNPTFTTEPTNEPTITPTMEPTISPTTGKKDNSKALAYGLGFGLGFGIPILIIIILGLIFYFKFDESEREEYINRYCSCCVNDSNKSGNTKDIETQKLTSDRGDGGGTTN